MTPDLLLRLVVAPTLSWLGDLGVKSDERAAVLLLAIAGQECGYDNRCQVVAGARKGPARGLWQFERPGGVTGVLNHPASRGVAAMVCDTLLVKPDSYAVHEAIEFNDVLACAFARLLLWTDPKQIPIERDAAWQMYLRCWRPGRPHAEVWPMRWAAAVAAVP